MGLKQIITKLLAFVTCAALSLLIVSGAVTPLSAQAEEKPDAADENEINKIFEEEKEGPEPGAEQDEKTPETKSSKTDYPNRGGLYEYVDQSRRSYKLDMMAAVDLVGGWDNETLHTTDNSFKIREAELGFFAAIDHLGEGVLSVAAHNEGGEYLMEIHEAYFFFRDTFIPNTSIRLGQFFYDVGRLNTIHRHDWSFTNAPLVHEMMLDEEAAGDAGIEFRILMPWDFWQELSIGVFNGQTFGHTHGAEPTKQNPLFTVHLKQFVHLGGDWGTQFGFSWLRWHPTENPNRVTQQSGLDWLVKWQKGHLRSFQFLTEVWYRETRQVKARPLDADAPPVETRVGAYSFFEYQFLANWYAGLRFDIFTDPNLRGDQGFHIKNGMSTESVMLTYRPSEFSYFRATGERSTDLVDGKRSYQYFLQADFIIGMHPAHVY